MKTKLTLLFCLLISLAAIEASAQKIIISGKEGVRPLKWSDFTGQPDAGSAFGAQTSWDLNYRYDGATVEDGKVVFSNLRIVLELNPQKSWVKKSEQTDNLLAHEQGHFNIALICLKEVMAKLAQRTFTAEDYKAGMRELFKTTLDKYYALDAKYDLETAHSIDKAAQQKWNEELKKQLE